MDTLLLFSLHLTQVHVYTNSIPIYVVCRLQDIVGITIFPDSDEINVNYCNYSADGHMGWVILLVKLWSLDKHYFGHYGQINLVSSAGILL